MSALTVPARSALLVPSPLAPSTSQPSDFGLQYPDLTAPLGAYNVAGFAYTITLVGADVYELTITGTGVVADGPTEGLTLDFEVTDVDGDTVSLSNGTHDVLSVVTGRRPLAEVTDAFALALDRSQSVKVVLTA